MKILKTRPYQQRYKGHKQVILNLYSPHGPEGTVMYSISASGQLFVWDLSQKLVTKEFLLKIPQCKIQNAQTMRISCAEFSGNIVYTGLLDGSVCSWSIQTADLIDKFVWHKQSVDHIHKINNRVLLTAGKQGRVNLWDTISGNLDKSFDYKSPITGVSYNQPMLTVINNRKSLSVLNLQTNNQVFRKQNELGRYFIKNFAFKDKIIIQMSDYMLQCYSSLQTQINWKVSFVNTWVNAIKLIGQYFICGCQDATIRLINIKSYQIVDCVKGHQLPINALELAFGKIFSASSDFYLMCWDIKEFINKLRQRKYMLQQDLESKRYQTYVKIMGKKKKKKKKSGKSKSKSKGKTSKSVKK